MEKVAESLRVIIGKRIQFFRIRKGLTQMEFAQKIGCTSTGAVSEVESGKKALSMDKLQLAAEVLEVPISLLVTPVTYDRSEKKVQLLIDLFKLFKQEGDPQILDILQTLVSAELAKH